MWLHIYACRPEGGVRWRGVLETHLPSWRNASCTAAGPALGWKMFFLQIFENFTKLTNLTNLIKNMFFDNFQILHILNHQFVSQIFKIVKNPPICEPSTFFTKNPKFDILEAKKHTFLRNVKTPWENEKPILKKHTFFGKFSKMAIFPKKLSFLAISAKSWFWPKYLCRFFPVIYQKHIFHIPKMVPPPIVTAVRSPGRADPLFLPVNRGTFYLPRGTFWPKS